MTFSFWLIFGSFWLLLKPAKFFGLAVLLAKNALSPKPNHHGKVSLVHILDTHSGSCNRKDICKFLHFYKGAWIWWIVTCEWDHASTSTATSTSRWCDRQRHFRFELRRKWISTRQISFEDLRWFIELAPNRLRFSWKRSRLTRRFVGVARQVVVFGLGSIQ